MLTGMDDFMDYILTEMSAKEFATLLAQTSMSHEQQAWLTALASERESELIYLHVMDPNEY